MRISKYKNKLKICPSCNKEFIAKYDTSKKQQVYCGVRCSKKNIIITEEWKLNNSKAKKIQWEDPNYRDMQRNAHLGNDGYWKGKKRPEETCKKMGLGHKGKPLSEEHRAKLSKISIETWKNGDIREKRIKGLKGNLCSDIKKDKISKANKIIYNTKERRMEAAESRRGDKSHFWRGGISPQNEVVRKSLDYSLWREGVFERDNYTCQECGDKNGNGHTVHLEAHHIKPFYSNPELRFDISNGITLCKKCHRLTDNFGSKAINGKTNLAHRATQNK